MKARVEPAEKGGGEGPTRDEGSSLSLQLAVLKSAEGFTFNLGIKRPSSGYPAMLGNSFPECVGQNKSNNLCVFIAIKRPQVP